MGAGAMKKARYKGQGIDFVLWDKVDFGLWGTGTRRENGRV